MNPVSYSMYWMSSKLGCWTPTLPPRWVSEAMDVWVEKYIRPITSIESKTITKYYKGKTFIYKIQYIITCGRLDIVCDKKLRTRS